MKRTFTLLLAALVASVTYALPLRQTEEQKLLSSARTEAAVSALSGQKQLTAQELLQKKMEAAPEKKAQLEAWQHRHAFERNLLTQNAKRALKPAASSASGSVIELQADPDGFLSHLAYYEEGGDWYIGFPDVTGNYVIRFDWFNGNPDSPYGVYTTEDLDLGYSYIEDEANWSYVMYESCNLSFTEEVISPKLSLAKLDATIEGDDGNTYHITGTGELLTPADTVRRTIHGGSYEYDSEEYLLFVEGTEGDNSVEFYSLAESQIGTIDLAYLQDVFVTVDGEDLDILKVANAKTGIDETLTDYILSLSVISTDTILYEIEVICGLPEGETIELTLNNLTIDDSWYDWTGVVFVNASNNDYVVALNIDAIMGTFTVEEGNLFGTIETTDAAYELLSGTLVVAKDEKGEFTAELTCLAGDFNTYVIHMSWFIPEPTSLKEIVFNTCAKVNAYVDYEELIIWNEDEDYYLRLDITGWTPGEKVEFDRSVLNNYYTSMIDYNIGEYAYVDLAGAVGTIEQVGDTLKLQASLISWDAVQYDVTMWYAVPEPADVVEIPAIEEAEFTNALSTKQYQIYGVSPDGQYEVCFTPASTRQIPGTYKNTYDFSAADIDLNYSFIGVADGLTDSDYTLYAILTAEVNVTMDENGVITATGWYLCENTVKYNFTLVTLYDKEHIQYDEPETPVDMQMTPANYEFSFSDAFDTYHNIAFYANGLEPGEAGTKDYLSLFFYPESRDEAYVIPAGTYEIDGSYSTGTVVAGELYYGNIFGSVFAQKSGTYITDPLYFLVGGSVTVEHVGESDLHIVVDAYNSYDLPVKIDVNTASATAVTNTDADGETTIRKFVKNGQLFIQRGSRVYNVLGAAL